MTGITVTGGRQVVAARPAGRAGRWPAEARWGLLFVLPVVGLFLGLRIVPALSAFYFSLTDFSAIGQARWVGLRNYRHLLDDDVFHLALVNTATYAAGSVLPAAALGLVLALLLNRRLRGLAIYRMAYYSPVVVSMVSVSMIWIYLFNAEFGVVNYALSLGGLPKFGWLDEPHLALPSIIIVGVWKNLAYDALVYLASLQAIPAEFHEAAMVDGAGAWHRFRHVTWPLLVPTTVFVLLMTGIFALQAFDQILVLTAGGPANATTTVVFEIYRNAFQFLKMGYASAMAFVLFCVIFAVSMLTLGMGRGAFRY
jgi:multiple sugar transport system permease protein